LCECQPDGQTLLRLADAVERYRREGRAPSNSYVWYRRSAAREGSVWIGRNEVRAWKEKNAWYVDFDDFEAAIARHRRERTRMVSVTRDLRRGIIHGSDGDAVTTEEGGYDIRGDFRFVWSDQERARKKSHGTWYCNRCNLIAKTSHKKEECHRCADWGGCGQDCTLSEVRCTKCGARLAL